VLPTISHDEFAFLIRRAGVTLPEAKLAELYAAYAHVEAAVERVRRSGDAEPAHIFLPVDEGAVTP
jgi:hypothetical protein